MGFGEGGARPFHQDYRHYKYYGELRVQETIVEKPRAKAWPFICIQTLPFLCVGFAGKGAKTSWAHNPKHNE